MSYSKIRNDIAKMNDREILEQILTNQLFLFNHVWELPGDTLEERLDHALNYVRTFKLNVIKDSRYRRTKRVEGKGARHHSEKGDSPE